MNSSPPHPIPRPAGILFLMLSLFMPGCIDMNIENVNQPDTDDLLVTSEDVLQRAGEAFRLWNNAINSYGGPGPAMCTMADQNTCSWGSAAMNDLSSEPRRPFRNDPAYPYAYITRTFWNESYRVLTDLQDVLRKVEDEGMRVTDLRGEDVTPLLRAWCYFMDGVVHGYLALIFDQASIVKRGNLLGSGYHPYQEVAAAALASLDTARALLDRSDGGVLPSYYINGVTVDRDELRQLVNGFAARILVYLPRTAGENAQTPWERVIQYASGGPDHDLMPVMDDDRWLDELKLFGTYPGWIRIDHRIINLMDHDYPSRWPDDNRSWNTPDGNDPGEASSDDARLTSDFQYLQTNNFRPSRGYYHFSHYRYKRYDPWLAQHWQGAVPTFPAWENKLMLAEALARTGATEQAIAILNDPQGARKVRGGLPDIPAGLSQKEVLELIFYERDIELILTRAGTSFFDMRRRDMLQAGTPLHFPIPASELEILGLSLYTTDGEGDLSRGCWKGYDGLVSPPGADCQH